MRPKLTPLLVSLLLACSASLPSCSGGQGGPARVANPVRLGIERQVRQLEEARPLRLRYNPAPCDCPPFELRLPGGWVRAVWVNATAPEQEPLLRALLATGPERWPVAVQVAGKVEGDVLRTASGRYAVRLESTRVISAAVRLGESPAAAPPRPPPGSPPPPPADRAGGPTRGGDQPPPR